jgi:hypothetical protein
MFTKETVRKMCEYEYAPSLVGEAIEDYERPKPRLVVNNDRTNKGVSGNEVS